MSALASDADAVALRPMREGDLATVNAIEQRAYPFPWTLGIFRDCLRSGYACWVLERDRHVIGYSVLSVAAGEAHLLNLCVAPEVQSRGLGRRLLMRMIDVARGLRAERIFLEVRPSNPHAIALYHDTGFNEIGRRRGYYPAPGGREDALVLAFELLPPEA
ncbi:ribosomal protein S18-alanine N-acetyltransferase [Coralloluteibacterium stylophorae]|uniref:[Ribosomal protein bS18]-alanine N-acetyltransferase n=1 Tax=Coralloluteibacterium stylophorae TaxID=1776034 RepID=A0A8J7VWG6_9GAMM|nr:ribosomal protein S18-alanine N-acetyltransferase [Coralloluteibacterium stylophorae]MBS7457795.1 ribosomal protein S18-alanine N-acetyltransferase [Coralloluteibacterium stylophorae]